MKSSLELVITAILLWVSLSVVVATQQFLVSAQEKPQEWSANDVTSSFIVAGWLKHAERITIHLNGGQTIFITGSTLKQLEQELSACHAEEVSRAKKASKKKD